LRDTRLVANIPFAAQSPDCHELASTLTGQVPAFEPGASVPPTSAHVNLARKSTTPFQTAGRNSLRKWVAVSKRAALSERAFGFSGVLVLSEAVLVIVIDVSIDETWMAPSGGRSGGRRNMNGGET